MFSLLIYNKKVIYFSCQSKLAMNSHDHNKLFLLPTLIGTSMGCTLMFVQKRKKEVYFKKGHILNFMGLVCNYVFVGGILRSRFEDIYINI
jgi:putative effector of murein hydrolase